MGKPIDAFGGRTWEELEVREHPDTGQLMFPAVIRRRTASGQVRENKVLVRVPSPEDTFTARANARKELKKRELDEDRDKDLFEQLEQLELLALCVRTETGAQFQKARDFHDYDEGCLQDIQEQLMRFKAELDPRDRVQSEEGFWRLVVDVARSASIGPLADTDGRDHEPFVVRMATELCRSPIASSWLQSFGISMPERSPSTSSEES